MTIIPYDGQGFEACPTFLSQDKLRVIRYPAYAELKLDGEFCTADTLHYPENGLLIGKNGKARIDCPILREMPKDSIILGELYYGEGKAGELYSLLSNQLSDELKFAAFDIVCHEGQAFSHLPYEDRREALLDIVGTEHVSVIDTWYCENHEDVRAVLEMSKARGYEGIVVKNTGPLGMQWVKIKHTQTADLKVLVVDPYHERIEVAVPVGKYHSRRVGVKVTNKVKHTLNPGDIVEIRHYGVLSSGGLRHPVFVRKREPKRVSL